MTAQASPPALGEQEADTRRPFSDAIEAAAAITPAKASQPEQPGYLPAGWLGPASGAMVGLTVNASLIARGECRWCQPARHRPYRPGRAGGSRVVHGHRPVCGGLVAQRTGAGAGP